MALGCQKTSCFL
jgi:predicted  nucleic acid-binding Zn-ribbon protein